jgi:hypothetical protein
VRGIDGPSPPCVYEEASFDDASSACGRSALRMGEGSRVLR